MGSRGDPWRPFRGCDGLTLGAERFCNRAEPPGGRGRLASMRSLSLLLRLGEGERLPRKDVYALIEVNGPDLLLQERMTEEAVDSDSRRC